MASHFRNIQVRIKQAAEILDLEPWLRSKLCGFKLRWACDLEAKMDDGSLRQFRAVRIWHRSPHTDQPHKGGMRFHPNVTEEQMMSHAMEMSLKCWIMGLEWGGAKGGVALDPAEHSPQELKNITEALVDEMDERGILGPYRDVPAPDVGTDTRVMNWIRQRYSQRRRSLEDARFAGVVTGKPVGYGFGGIPGRKEATGYGLVQVLETYLKLRDIDKKDIKRVAIMGFGNVGYHVALFLAQKDFSIIAISDVDGGIYNPKGLKIKDFEDKSKVSEISNGKPITNKQLLELKDIDILVPAALENVITKNNARRIKAKFIIEGANGPTTPEADTILQKRKIEVIPDILANAGGVTVSFFEWARNLSIKDERVPRAIKEEVLNSLSDMMSAATKEVFGYAQKYDVSMRLAAYLMAIERAAPLFKTKHTAV
ncbi:MAG: Glu/Leu/Phe/Val dehydrogenase [Candidatus Paceibacterota bacterium]